MKKDVFLKETNPYFWIIALGFVVYLKALFFNFTYLDDNALILDYYYFIRNLTNVFYSFTQDVFQITHALDAYYRPILTISFILDAQLGKTSPFIYHFTNLSLHLIASCLVFIFLKKLKYQKSLAFLSALIFTVHPVLTQAVVWIPGRNDSLVTIFILAAFIFWINFLETKKWPPFAWHLLFFALALFTKELAILLPLFCLLHLWLIGKKKLTSDEKKFLILGWPSVLIIWFLFRQSALENPIKYAFLDILKSLPFHSPAIVLYLGKIIFPVNLSVLPIIQDSTLLYGIITIILVTILLFLSKEKRLNYLIFGLIWFLIFLFPSFIRPDPDVVAYFIEHRVYLPFVGLIVVLSEIDFVKKFNLNRKICLLLSGSIILILSITTIIHSQNFKNRINFWENAVKTSPHHPLAHRNLGAMYYLDGRLDDAEVEYKKSLELNPSEQMAHNNLGLIYTDRGLLDKAEEEYKKELEVNPLYDTAHFNLGMLYAKQQKLEKAAEWWQKTVAINPEYFSAHINLAVYYYQQKEFNKAIYHVNEVLKRGGQVPVELLQKLRPYANNL